VPLRNEWLKMLNWLEEQGCKTGWLSPDPSGWQWWCAQLIVDYHVHSHQGMTQKCQDRCCPWRMVPVKTGYVIYAWFVHYSVEFYFSIWPFMIFTLYNIDYILNIVYYHVYNHSKQLELSVQFMFSCNRDFHSSCWGEFVQKHNSTMFNGIDGTGVASNIKTQIQFNTPSCMSKLVWMMQTQTFILTT